jgi:hypothetical protein
MIDLENVKSKTRAEIDALLEENSITVKFLSMGFENEEVYDASSQFEEKLQLKFESNSKKECYRFMRKEVEEIVEQASLRPKKEDPEPQNLYLARKSSLKKSNSSSPTKKVQINENTEERIFDNSIEEIKNGKKPNLTIDTGAKNDTLSPVEIKYKQLLEDKRKKNNNRYLLV